MKLYRHAFTPRITQGQLGEWLGLGQAQISVVERMPHPRDFEQLRRWAALLQVPESLLWFRPARRPHPRERLPEAKPDEPPERSLPAALAPDPEASDHDGVEAIRTRIRMFQAADRQLGGGAIYQSVVRYLTTDIARRLLDVDGDDELFAAATSVAQIAGWMAHDAGRDDRARDHFARAARLARTTDDPALEADVFAAQAHLAIQTARSADAVALADAGLERLRNRNAPSLLSRLHALRAHALANTGNIRASTHALNTAESSLERAGEGDSGQHWIAPFDRGSLAAEAVATLHALGDLREAEQQARLVLAERSGDRIRSRSFGELALARVLLASGRPEEAAEIGITLADVVSTLTSARAHHQLCQLGRQLSGHAGLPAVRDFLDRLRIVEEVR